jgi:hypothetical protein
LPKASARAELRASFCAYQFHSSTRLDWRLATGPRIDVNLPSRCALASLPRPARKKIALSCIIVCGGTAVDWWWRKMDHKRKASSSAGIADGDDRALKRQKTPGVSSMSMQFCTWPERSRVVLLAAISMGGSQFQCRLPSCRKKEDKQQRTGVYSPGPPRGKHTAITFFACLQKQSTLTMGTATIRLQPHAGRNPRVHIRLRVTLSGDNPKDQGQEVS